MGQPRKPDICMDCHTPIIRNVRDERRCKSCKTKWRQKYRNRNRKRIIATRTARRQLLRNVAAQFKLVPCVDCSHTYHPCAMDFDHTNPSKKTYNICRDMKSMTEDKLINEILKCEIVCANCHRIRTWERKEAIKFSKIASSRSFRNK